MNSNERGLTLLEVLVALAIFAMSAMALIRSVGQHINTLSLIEQKTFAAMVADNQMAKVMLDPQGLRKMSGKETLAGHEWFWTIAPVSTQQSLIRAFDVEVAREAKGEALISVRSYVPK